jgi:hypothetical protein
MTTVTLNIKECFAERVEGGNSINHVLYVGKSPFYFVIFPLNYVALITHILNQVLNGIQI